MTTRAGPGESARPLLEVLCTQPRDVSAAVAGGADRVLLVLDPAAGGRTPSPAEVSAACRESDVPVRALLREHPADRAPADAETARRMVDRGRELLALGAEGLAFGFLDAGLEVDAPATAGLARALGCPWSFHRGFDAALSAPRAWRSARALGADFAMDGVATGGSGEGLARGGEELAARAAADPEVARLVVAAGGLTPESVAWLVRCGVRRLQLGAEARIDGSWHRADVDAALVRSWRGLLDAECARLDPGDPAVTG